MDWLKGHVPKKGLERVDWELKELRRELENKLGRPVPDWRGQVEFTVIV